MKNKLQICVLVVFFVLLSCQDSQERGIDWKIIEITETEYSIRLETRFNNNQLLYILRMISYDNDLMRLANTVTVELLDREGFVLGIIEPESWVRNNGNEDGVIGVLSRGNMPMTRGNYREIAGWSVRWSN